MLKSPLLRWLALLALGWFAMVIFGIFANSNLIMAPGWWQGLACGVGMAWAWTQAKAIRVMGQVLGFALLASMILGLIDSQQFQVRALFQGLSIGFSVGFVIFGLLSWKRTYTYFLQFFQSSGDDIAVRWFKQFKPK